MAGHGEKFGRKKEEAIAALYLLFARPDSDAKSLLSVSRSWT